MQVSPCILRSCILVTSTEFSQFLEVTVLSRGNKGTIAIGLSKNEKDAADKQPGWTQGTIYPLMTYLI